MKSYPAIHGMLIVAMSISVLSIISNNQSKDHISDWLTTAPTYFLSQAKMELGRNHAYSCKDNLRDAIGSIASIETYSSSKVNYYLDHSIAELEGIIQYIEEGHLNMSDLNHAYFNAINSVAYAELMISEIEFDEGKSEHSLFLMNTVLGLMKKSLAYVDTNENLRTEEMHVINHIATMISEIERKGSFSSEEFVTINNEIEMLLDSL